VTPFQANVPLVVDGVAVMPGHYVLADSSGAVVIPDVQIEEVLAEARKVEAADAAFRDQIAREQIRDKRNRSGLAKGDHHELSFRRSAYPCWAGTEHRRKDNTMNDNTETAILAGGCFWGVQELLRHHDGVISTRVGYTGGQNDNPTYRNHPGHAEAVEIVFDPERISYRDILEFFFQIHDPTTKDRQGNDIGSSYRSEIFYTSDEQRQVAQNTIADVDASGLWPGKVVTEVSEAVPFWEAEPEHQDYLQRYPNGYTCHFPRPGWKLPHRESAA
jgi:peptide-methionine (S)-S-oxide reductase